MVGIGRSQDKLTNSEGYVLVLLRDSNNNATLCSQSHVELFRTLAMSTIPS